ncbi:MAG: deoxyribose-phosphate aldolase [bacterium]|jgi:deoxyribose-phosphate aldolase|nr:deoxyribose-phosphate aldolase [bacterium]
MDFDQKLAQIIDYAVLKPDTTNADIDRACQEAIKYRFAAVCVNPSYVPLAAKLLHGSGIKVSAVIGFPLGASTSTVKSIEARNALLNGADEIDMVLNIGALKSNEIEIVDEEIKMVRNVTNGHVLKVILETCLLSKEEKVKACEIASSQGVNFIKTSTGFSNSGATVDDIKLIRQVVGIEMGVKASGGIDTAEKAYVLMEAGATRIGTSHAVDLVSGERKR